MVSKGGRRHSVLSLWYSYNFSTHFPNYLPLFFILHSRSHSLSLTLIFFAFSFHLALLVATAFNRFTYLCVSVCECVCVCEAEEIYEAISFVFAALYSEGASNVNSYGKFLKSFH